MLVQKEGGSGIHEVLTSVSYIRTSRDLKNNQLTRIEAHYFTDLSREGSVLNHNSLTAL